MPSRDDIRRRDQFAALLLLALIAALGIALILRRSMFQDVDLLGRQMRLQHEAIEFDHFSARREHSTEGDRLSVFLRVRTTQSVSLPCYIFLVARNDQATPKLWGIWPPQPPGPAITASGHFHGATPTSGYSLTLSDQWQRVSATIPDPGSGAMFDTVVAYVVDPDGRILLSRPFRV
jgi:hypothetical protein